MRILFFLAGSVFYFFSQNNDNLRFDSYAPEVEEAETGYISDPAENDTYTIEEEEYEDGNEDTYMDDSEPEEDFEEGYYTPDNNPVTWDEDPDNYPLETPDTYVNVDGDEVQSPTQYNDIPEGACAICADGTYSFSRNRRGTCSHHGGVAQWLR